jgi:peptidoglycan L-alanyl-D-glutamate endopeptidase CwlK
LGSHCRTDSGSHTTDLFHHGEVEMSRKIEDLEPEAQEKCVSFIKACESEGTEVLIYSTRRSEKEQALLFAQGRQLDTLPEEVMDLIRNEIWKWRGEGFRYGPGNIVTNTMKSKHIKGTAFDCCPMVDEKLVWDNNELWEKIGKIGEDLGLEWGGRWKMQDKPHFQLKEILL